MIRHFSRTTQRHGRRWIKNTSLLIGADEREPLAPRGRRAGPPFGCDEVPQVPARPPAEQRTLAVPRARRRVERAALLRGDGFRNRLARRPPRRRRVRRRRLKLARPRPPPPPRGLARDRSEPLANRGGTSATASDAMPVLTCLTSRFRSVRRPEPSASSASSSPTKASAKSPRSREPSSHPVSLATEHPSSFVSASASRVSRSISGPENKRAFAMPAMHCAFRRPATSGQTSAPRRFASSRRNSDSRARLSSPSGPSACGRAASPSAAMADAERGGVLNTTRSATSRPCSTSLSDSTIKRFCTFVGARNVPQWRRAASFSSFLFRLFCAARFAPARCSLGVDASPSPSRRTMCVASLAPLANPVAVLLPENVRSAVEGVQVQQPRARRHATDLVRGCFFRDDVGRAQLSVGSLRVVRPGHGQLRDLFHGAARRGARRTPM